MVKTISSFSVLTVVLLSMIVTPTAAQEPSGWMLSELVDSALAGNPALQAAKDRQLSAGYRVDPAGALADPVVSFVFSNYPVDSFATDETPMTGNEIRLAQKLPFPGKLGTRKDVAAKDALWQQGLYEDSRFDLVRQVKEGYFKLYAVDRSIATVQTNLSLLDHIARLSETRYQVGKGKQANVLKVHLELTRQRDRLIQLEQRRQVVQGNLNRLANRPIADSISTPGSISVVRFKPELEALQQSAEENRPLYSAWQARVDKARKQKKLAELDYKPDFTLWAGYRFRDDNLADQGTDFASAGISFNLPLNRSRRADAVSASAAGLNEVYNRFADFRSRTAYELNESYHAARNGFDLYELYRTGVVPQARQVYAASLAAYQVGKVDFQELLNALLALDRYETELHRVVSDYLVAVARLESISATTIDVISREN